MRSRRGGTDFFWVGEPISSIFKAPFPEFVGLVVQCVVPKYFLGCYYLQLKPFLQFRQWEHLKRAQKGRPWRLRRHGAPKGILFQFCETCVGTLCRVGTGGSRCRVAPRGHIPRVRPFLVLHFWSICVFFEVPPFSRYFGKIDFLTPGRPKNG